LSFQQLVFLFVRIGLEWPVMLHQHSVSGNQSAELEMVEKGDVYRSRNRIQ
jgi:hypothetical protein